MPSRGNLASTAGANVQQRRVLSLANPVEGTKYGSLTNLDDGGTGSYNGLLLSLQWGTQGILYVVAVPSLIAATAAFFLRSSSERLKSESGNMAI